MPTSSENPLVPKIWVQDPINQQLLQICRTCCKSLGNPISQLARAAGNPEKCAVGDTLPELKAAFPSASSSCVANAIYCDSHCGASYCSEQCRSVDWELSHRILCVGPLEEGDALVEFMRMGIQSEWYIELMLAAKLAVISGEAEVDRWTTLGSKVKNVDGVFIEAWELIKLSSVVSRLEWSQKAWIGLCDHVLAKRVELEVRSFPQIYMETLYYSSKSTQDLAQDAILDLVEDQEELPADLNAEQKLRKIMADPSGYFPSVYLSAVFTELDNVNHSCSPNFRIEVSKDSSLNGLSVWLSRSLDRAMDVEKTIARVDVSGTKEERAELLHSSLGIVGPCKCVRCTCDCQTEQDLGKLRYLAEDAMANERYECALQYSEAVLRIDPLDGKALYERARVTSWRDEWSEAHQMLLEAHRLVPDNKEIASELQSHKAYALDSASKLHPPSPLRPFNLELYDGKVRVYDELLQKDKCREVVAEVEAFVARNGGWTTSRHYAVPTTDIPVHAIPAVLAWFNASMSDRIVPALTDQFDVAADRVRVIDAFVVKYNASKQRSLPLHCDQSQFSLTIAMNDRGEYEGGGTFFEANGDVVNCDTGGVISFEGALLHGGYPVYKGIRYVVVAFLYEDQTVSNVDPS